MLVCYSIAMMDRIELNANNIFVFSRMSLMWPDVLHRLNAVMITGT